MKFPVAAVMAVCAASTVQGFSITMSSYLDNLGATGGLSSFAPSGGYSAPAPPTYSAPAPSYAAPAAPAPAPYQSAFADAPANSDLNYMASLGSGGQMKSGPNFSGVSSSFTPVTQSISNSVYLDNLKGAAMTSFAGASPASYSAPAPASYQSSAPAPAPVNTGSYLENLSGSGSAVSSSYSSMQNSFAAATTAAPASTAGYLGSL